MRVWRRCTRTELLIFVTPGHNCLWNEDILFYLFSFDLSAGPSVFHVGHHLMSKDDVNISYVTHDIINLLPTKSLLSPLLLFAAISVSIRVMKVMIIRCFKLNYKHGTSLEAPSPSDGLLARTPQLQSIIELRLSYMVTLSKLTNGKFLHTPLKLHTLCIHI